MPHCELHFSDNLNLDAKAILAKVEAIINAHDPNAHECKGRAYPAAIYHRPHLKVTVSLLTRPHRDEVFTKALMTDLEVQIKVMVPQSCYFSLLIEYSPTYYITNEHLVAGDDLPRYDPR
ncbi:MAG: hypothetical protein AAF629_30890 [Chloroflexota bacterium]